MRLLRKYNGSFLKTMYVIIAFCFYFQAVAQNNIQTIFNELKNHPDLKNASISFYAYNMDDNKELININGDLALIPASTLKLITTATALEILGKDYTFQTKIAYSGTVENGILNGNIYIIGGGDPALGSHRYSSFYGDFLEQWKSSIQSMGIDSINGQIIGDASIFDNEIPPTWIWQDLGNYFGAGANGLSIYENFYYLHLSSTNGVSITDIQPKIPQLKIENYLNAGSTHRDLSYIYGGPYQYNRYISGEIPNNKNRFTVKGSIPDPAFLCAYQLDSLLKINGVNICLPPTTLRLSPQKVAHPLTEITSTQSPSLASIISQTNLYSINLYAEHLLNHVGLKIKNKGGFDAGIEAIIEFWKSKGIDMDGMNLHDGSGLSRFNTLTTKQLSAILQYMAKSTNHDVFEQSLAVAGKTGTLRSMAQNTSAEGKIIGKSGYMTNVRSYAGYIKTKSNKKAVFAIIVNNYNCTAFEMKKILEKVLIGLTNEN